MKCIKIRKTAAAALILIISVITGGCAGNIQMEDRNYVMALGIDYDGQQLSAAMSFPDLEALIGKGSNIHYPVTTVTGNNLAEIEENYQLEANKKLDYGQLQVIVFGKALLENPPAMEQVLSYIKNRQTFTRTILVCRAEDKAEDIIALDESVNGPVGLYIKDMFENNAAVSGYEKSTVNDMITAWKNGRETVPLAVLSVTSEKIPRIEGEIDYKME